MPRLKQSLSILIALIVVWASASPALATPFQFGVTGRGGMALHADDDLDEELPVGIGLGGRIFGLVGLSEWVMPGIFIDLDLYGHQQNDGDQSSTHTFILPTVGASARFVFTENISAMLLTKVSAATVGPSPWYRF